MQLVEPIRNARDLDNLKRYLKERNLRDWALVTLGCNSGLRIGDLLRLRVQDIAEGPKIRDRLQVTERKTGKPKRFPLGPKVQRVLAEYLKATGLQPDDWLFPSPKGGALGTRQAERILSAGAKAVGITEPISTHSLRKTFGYHLYQRGVDVTRIQAMLNHASPQVTLRYIGITQEELDDLYLSLDL